MNIPSFKMSLASLLVFVISLSVVSCQLFNIRDNAAWFQTGNGLRNRLVTGGIKGKNNACSVTRNRRLFRGVCTNLKECVLSGGVSAGSCALVGTCCIIERSCGRSTNAKVSYFVSPATFQNIQSQTTIQDDQQQIEPQGFQNTCSFTVNSFSPNVCQLRLDFERFNLAEPTPLQQFVTAHQCQIDSFRVTSRVAGNNNGFQHLCGFNDGQHIYVPFNGSLGSNHVTLDMFLSTDRSLDQTIIPATPEWRIRITQLECRPAALDFTSVQSALVTMYQKHKDKKNNNFLADEELIAPPGCLQYYPNAVGNYSSFNYPGRYIGNMKYAICFRRLPGMCGIRHTAQGIGSFDINGNQIPDPITNNPCINNNPAAADPDLNNPNNSLDYLFIPGATDPVQEYYCHQDLTSAISTSPGPPYVVFSTDGFTPYNSAENPGFRINYEILYTGCLSI